jgi:septum formation topological specificity factor MinE
MKKEELLDVLNNYKNKSNKQLELALDKINKDFELTKETILKLTIQLDEIEKTYNNIFEEYKKRTSNG